MHSSKHTMEELGKELTRSCEGRNKTIVPKMIRKQGIAFCKEMVFLYTHLAGNFYPHPLIFFSTGFFHYNDLFLVHIYYF